MTELEKELLAALNKLIAWIDTDNIYLDENCIKDAEYARAAIQHAETAQGEPVAWATFDGEAIYEIRMYAGNESYKDDFERANPNHRGRVIPLYAEPVKVEGEPVAELGYIDLFTLDFLEDSSEDGMIATTFYRRRMDFSQVAIYTAPHPAQAEPPHQAKATANAWEGVVSSSFIYDYEIPQGGRSCIEVAPQPAQADLDVKKILEATAIDLGKKLVKAEFELAELKSQPAQANEDAANLSQYAAGLLAENDKLKAELAALKASPAQAETCEWHQVTDYDNAPFALFKSRCGKELEIAESDFHGLSMTNCMFCGKPIKEAL